MARDEELLDKKIYLECECGEWDHTVRVSLWDWRTEPPEAYIEYRLNHHESFWERLRSAANYVFGYNGETLNYHDVMLTEASIDRLISFCRDYKLAKELYELGKKDDSRNA